MHATWAGCLMHGGCVHVTMLSYCERVHAVSPAHDISELCAGLVLQRSSNAGRVGVCPTHSAQVCKGSMACTTAEPLAVCALPTASSTVITALVQWAAGLAGLLRAHLVLEHAPVVELLAVLRTSHGSIQISNFGDALPAAVRIVLLQERGRNARVLTS